MCCPEVWHRLITCLSHQNHHNITLDNLHLRSPVRPLTHNKLTTYLPHDTKDLIAEKTNQQQCDTCVIDLLPTEQSA